MVKINTEKFFPVAIGFSVALTFAGVANSLAFNLIAWHLSGRNQTFENMYTQVPSFPFYNVFAFIIGIIAYTLAGFVAAKLSKSQPYYTAMYTGVSYLFGQYICNSPVRYK